MEVSGKKYLQPWIKIFAIIYRYTAEVNMPDSLSLYAQLGAPPPRSAHPVPTADCHQLFDWETGHIHRDLVPRAAP